MKITLPPGSTAVKDRQFEEHHGLLSITLPHSVTRIGSRAFMNCNQLTQFKAPPLLDKMGDHAFKNCHQLKSVIFQSPLRCIPWSAFQGCYQLKHITLPSSLTSIGQHAFYDCRQLTSVSLPKGVNHIGNSAFYNCTQLRQITLPEGITSLGHGAFYHCQHLTQITLPSTLSTLGEHAFYGCNNLHRINSLKNVTTISNHAFRNCMSLTSIHLSPRISNIGELAFAGCSQLQYIVVDTLADVDKTRRLLPPSLRHKVITIHQRNLKKIAHTQLTVFAKYHNLFVEGKNAVELNNDTAYRVYQFLSFKELMLLSVLCRGCRGIALHYRQIQSIHAPNPPPQLTHEVSLYFLTHIRSHVPPKNSYLLLLHQYTIQIQSIVWSNTPTTHGNEHTDNEHNNVTALNSSDTHQMTPPFFRCVLQ